MKTPMEAAQNTQEIIKKRGFKAALEHLMTLPQKEVLAEPILGLYLHCLENLDHKIDSNKAAEILEQVVKNDLFKLNIVIGLLTQKINQNPIINDDIFSVDQLRIIMRYKVIALGRFEHSLIKSRNKLLINTLRNGGFSSEDEEKIFLIAIQQHHKEYATYISKDEQDIIAQIKSLIEKKMDNIDEITSESVYLYIYAMFEDLATIKGLKNKSYDSLPDGLKTLFYLSFEFPKIIKNIAKKIPQATPISEGASEIVRAQYEENPYPRWQTTRYPEVKSPQEFYSKCAPYMEQNTRLPVPNDVLIAGCGTGQQPISCAQRIPSSKIVAIDLSLNSLGYAKYKANQHGINNITFKQADIMNINHLDQQFDFIDCSGVLHHLAEPEKGLDRLLTCLKPNGCIKISVYSTLARKKILEDQQLVSKHKLEPTLNNIREYRSRRLVVSNGSDINCPTAFIDFYNTSMCRDLIFHTHEKTYSWLEIQRLADQANLEIIGIEVSEDVQRMFKEMYPSDNSWLDTECWNTFEENNPNSFQAMMRFYMQRKA